MLALALLLCSALFLSCWLLLEQEPCLAGSLFYSLQISNVFTFSPFVLLLPRMSMIGDAACYSKNKNTVLFSKTLPSKTRDRWKKADGEYKESVTQHQSTLSGSKIIAAAVLPL